VFTNVSLCNASSTGFWGVPSRMEKYSSVRRASSLLIVKEEGRRHAK